MSASTLKVIVCVSRCSKGSMCSRSDFRCSLAQRSLSKASSSDGTCGGQGTSSGKPGGRGKSRSHSGVGTRYAPLVAQDKREPKQTLPKTGERIPLPKRADVFRDLKKAAKGSGPRRPQK